MLGRKDIYYGNNLLETSHNTIVGWLGNRALRLHNNNKGELSNAVPARTLPAVRGDAVYGLKE